MVPVHVLISTICRVEVPPSKLLTHESDVHFLLSVGMFEPLKKSPEIENPIRRASQTPTLTWVLIWKSPKLMVQYCSCDGPFSLSNRNQGTLTTDDDTFIFYFGQNSGPENAISRDMFAEQFGLSLWCNIVPAVFIAPLFAPQTLCPPPSSKKD